jgi:hypothetical protein
MAGFDTGSPRIIDSRHPNLLSSLSDWEKWRLTYRGGEEFRDRYIEKFSTREDDNDFLARKRTTPIPAFAKAAINKIRNAIFQRMRDIVRIGGSQNYQNAVNGLDLGVDRRGNNMNAFLGMRVLTDLLVMGRAGVFVDNSVVEGVTMADSIGARPYLYPYQVEDILSWSCTSPDSPSNFHSLLLRDTCLNFDRRTNLPVETFQRFRLLWIDDETGNVNLQFYNATGVPVDRDNNPAGPIELQLKRIPFVMLDIQDSLIKDVCQHQIAMLNMASSDVNYLLKAGFPFYTEQRDMRAVGAHLKQTANADGTATTGGQGASDQDIRVGVTQGRIYPLGANQPAFIAPPTDPIRASGEYQDRLEQQISKLVNLAVAGLGTKNGATTNDNDGLEAGLSFIGLVLESAERQIAEFWAAYEEKNPNNRQIATIKYPDRYSLKDDEARIDESTKLSKLMYSLPGRTVKKEIAKAVVYSLLSGKTDLETINKINSEIDNAPYLTSEPNTIIQASEAGLVGEQTASMALGFTDQEYIQAREDHALRVARIQAAQSAVNPGPTRVQGSRGANASIIPPVPALPEPGDPAARGVKDLSANPAAGRQEKAASRDNTLRDTKGDRTRGNAAKAPVTGAKG